MLYFITNFENGLANLTASIATMLIGFTIGTVVFLALWLLAFLWRKLIIKLIAGVYEGTRPGRFAICFCSAIAIIPIAVILQQAVTTMGFHMSFVPEFLRVWLFVLSGFLLATPILMVRNFLRRKKPEPKIFEPTVSDR